VRAMASVTKDEGKARHHHANAPSAAQAAAGSIVSFSRCPCGSGKGGFMTTLFAFLHHVAAFTLMAAVAVEFVAIRPPLTLANARTLIGADAVLGVSATVLLVVGLLRVFYFEKGADYYFHSHAFMTKFSVFIAV